MISFCTLQTQRVGLEASLIDPQPPFKENKCGILLVESLDCS